MSKPKIVLVHGASGDASSCRSVFDRLDADEQLPDVEDLRAELKELVHSWQYAYAMGHGCSVGDHPAFRETRRQAADLRARIAELSE
jgi:hypothetical protein